MILFINYSCLFISYFDRRANRLLKYRQLNLKRQKAERKKSSTNKMSTGFIGNRSMTIADYGSSNTTMPLIFTNNNDRLIFDDSFETINRRIGAKVL